MLPTYLQQVCRGATVKRCTKFKINSIRILSLRPCIVHYLECSHKIHSNDHDENVNAPYCITTHLGGFLGFRQGSFQVQSVGPGTTPKAEIIDQYTSAHWRVMKGP